MYCRQKENDGFYGRNESKQQSKRNKGAAFERRQYLQYIRYYCVFG